MPELSLNDVRKPYAFISGIAQFHSPRPLLTLEQAEQVSAELNRITADTRPTSMVWGYEGGQGMTLGIVNNRGYFTPLSGNYLTPKQYVSLIEAVRYSAAYRPVPKCPTFEKGRIGAPGNPIKQHILIDPSRIIANMGWGKLGEPWETVKPALIANQWQQQVRSVLQRIYARIPDSLRFAGHVAGIHFS